MANINGDSSPETFDGGSGNDTINGGGGEDLLRGFGGDDVITDGGATLDPSFAFLQGGDGDDTLTVTGAGRLQGGRGNDTLTGLTSGDTDNIDFAIADFSDATGSVIANLSASSLLGVAGGSAGLFNVMDGQGFIDRVSGIHTLRDGLGDDRVRVDGTFMNSFGNWAEIRLTSGDDTVTFDGVATARISYSEAFGPVNADMGAGTATDLDPSNNLIGSDTFTGANQFRGSSFGDSVLGGDIAERIRGQGGDDTLDGLGGNDRIEGEDGNDIVRGGDGDDTVDGGSGQDIIFGDRGDDILRDGGAINSPEFDNLIGGEGNDQLFASGGARLQGGLGDDTLTGVTSGDIDNIDFIVADFSDSTGNVSANLTAASQFGLAGGSGGVFLVDDGQGGTDSISGVHTVRDGAGDDRFRVDSTFVNSFGNWAEIRLTSGDDRVDFDGVSIARVSYSEAVGAVRADMGAGTATDLNASDSFIGLDTFTGANQFRGSAAGDEINGSSAAERLRGHAGDDTITGGGGPDRLDGEDGNDTITGGVDDDRITGGAGEDALNGGAGNDRIEGGSGGNFVVGGTGDDTFFIGLDNDFTVIEGNDGDGAGFDTLEFGPGIPQDGVRFICGGGDYGAVIGPLAPAFFLQAFEFGNSDPALMESLNITVLTSDESVERITFTQTGETIDILDGVLGDMGDTVAGGTGMDILFGRFGDDFLAGGDGNDVLFGNDGIDTLIGGDGGDLLDGGENPDTQGDVMLGGAGDDSYLVDSPLDFIDEGFVFTSTGFGGFDFIHSTSDFFWDVYGVGEVIQIGENVNDIGGDGEGGGGGVRQHPPRRHRRRGAVLGQQHPARPQRHRRAVRSRRVRHLPRRRRRRFHLA